MYINLESGISKSPRTNTFSGKYFDIFWEGTIFSPGLTEGKETISHLFGSINGSNNINNLISAIHKLRGNWSLALHNKSDSSWIVCTDNTHQENMYYSNKSVSNSFLDLRSEMIQFIM